MRVHLEGMGVVGSILAHELIAAGHDVTWSDIDRYRTAWKACTGCVFPSGNAADEQARLEWERIATTLGGSLRHYTEVCPYVFGSQKPPHGGHYSYSRTVLGLNVAEASEVVSVHVNAQLLVGDTRALLAHCELPQYPAPEYDIRIVTHGFSHLLKAEWWGWTVPVRIHRVDPTLPERACYYKHLGPAGGPNYAYPIPQTDLWYAGSTLRRSTNELHAEAEYRLWLRRFLEWTAGAVEVERAGDPIHGWRPSATSPALSKAVPEQWLHPFGPPEEKTWAVWPCATDGIRRAPLYVAAVNHLIDYGEAR